MYGKTLIDCIVETAIYDGKLTLDIWLYLLNMALEKKQMTYIDIEKTKDLIRKLS